MNWVEGKEEPESFDQPSVIIVSEGMMDDDDDYDNDVRMVTQLLTYSLWFPRVEVL